MLCTSDVVSHILIVLSDQNDYSYWQRPVAQWVRADDFWSSGLFAMVKEEGSNLVKAVSFRFDYVTPISRDGVWVFFFSRGTPV